MQIQLTTTPNWKEGLLMVLLSVFSWKSEVGALRYVSMGVVALLGLNFITVSFLLIRYNVVARVAVLEVERQIIALIDANGERQSAASYHKRKIPFNTLYWVTFETGKGSRTLVLNAVEAVMLDMAYKGSL